MARLPDESPAYAPRATVEHPIELADGSSFTFTFRPLTHNEFERFRLAAQSLDEVTAARATSMLIAFSLVDDEGKTYMSIERASALEDEVGKRLISKILEINGKTSAAAKRLASAAKKK